MPYFKIRRDPESNGGGGGDATASAAPTDVNSGSPAPAPDPGPGPSTSTPDIDNPSSQVSAPDGSQNSGTQGAGTQNIDSKDEYVITKLPGRNTPEYAAAYDELPFEDQLKLEQELNSLYDGSDESLRAAMDKKDGAEPTVDPANEDPNAQNDPNAAPPAEGENFTAISKDEFEKLTPAVQDTVRAMNKKVEDLSQYEDPNFQQGLDLISKDPVIQNRLEALKRGENGVTDHIKKNYDPNTHIDAERMKKLDFSSAAKEPASRQELADMLFEASQQGYAMAENNARLQKTEYEEKINTKVSVEKQLNAMVGDNPSMKSDLPFEHNDHPLKKFFEWVSAEGIPSKQLDKLGVKHVFTMYQSKTGGMKDIIDKQIQETKKQIFLDFDEMDNTARNMSRTTQTNNGVPQGQMYKGIDMTRYKSDNGYRARMYENADFETQLGLEKYVTQGVLPK